MDMEVTHHEIAYPLLNTCKTHINLTFICIINLNKLRNRKSETYDVFLVYKKDFDIFSSLVMPLS